MLGSIEVGRYSEVGLGSDSFDTLRFWKNHRYVFSPDARKRRYPSTGITAPPTPDTDPTPRPERRDARAIDLGSSAVSYVTEKVPPDYEDVLGHVDRMLQAELAGKRAMTETVELLMPDAELSGETITDAEIASWSQQPVNR